MYRNTIISTIIILVFAVGLLWLHHSKETDEARQLWGYTLTKKTHQENIQFLLFDGERERAEVTVINNIKPHMADQHVTEKVSIYSALFENQRAGYAGQQTEFVSCSDQFKPKLVVKSVTGGQLKYFQGYANNRYTTGVCDSRDIAFLSMEMYLNCKSIQTVYEISYFVPPTELDLAEKFVKKLDCEVN